MEVFLYNSNVCRLCGEENSHGSHLYTNEENNENLCDIINTYLPIKVSDDGELPRTICPGCTIQLEAAVEFLNLIINGQKVIRELHEREKEYRKTVLKSKEDSDVITEKIVYEINTTDGVYHVEHPISLQVAGLEKPKRKRGRPPKKPKTPEELAAEAAAKEQQALAQSVVREKVDSSSGKRRRKTPTRFKEVVQGAELERILKEEGVTDGEESEPEPRREAAREPEVIGHLEAGDRLVLVVRGKGRGRPKGRMCQKREQCVICGMEFTCLGRYMSHVAQHGPVRYRCDCGADYLKRLHFNDHQRETGHTGLVVVPIEPKDTKIKEKPHPDPVREQPKIEPLGIPDDVSTTEAQPAPGLPDLTDLIEAKQELVVEDGQDTAQCVVVSDPQSAVNPIVVAENIETEFLPEANEEKTEITKPAQPVKQKLKCNHCDKLFSNKQSKSLHTKAVHQGERPYVCAECGATFAYPRSLALHVLAHRRRARPAHHAHHASAAPGAKSATPAAGFACDLCGKVLNHPSSVVYHKQAAHAAQRYVCGACGKRFRHKQLLQRHQLVHSQARPFVCKICTATFKTKANLLNHHLLHTGVKKFTCEICKHKFAHKTSLTLHMRWHSGVKPFSCSVCGKSFSQKGNLSEHERIHTGEKPFACALCSRRFTTSSQHRLHARRHARARRDGSTGSKCGTCGAVFASRWALAQHARAQQHNASGRRKQAQKQMSLLVNDKQQVDAEAAATAIAEAEAEAVAIEEEGAERVIYVTYDVDDPDSPAFHILDPDQTVNLEESKVLSTCELYPGPSLLVPQLPPRLDLAHLKLERADAPDAPLDVEMQFENQQLPVTDEHGNQLHFTMQDGTRLAITSADGKSLQVVTQDGQTIPVEINNSEMDETQDMDSETEEHQLAIHKDSEAEDGSSVTHYYTLI